MRRPRKAVRLGIPGLVVAILMLVALWRVGSPVRSTGNSTTPPRPAPLTPLTQLAEVLAHNSIGRQASLEHVTITAIPSARTLWIGNRGGERAFVVLDPDVTLSPDARLVQGGRVTLIGLVRPSPKAEVAVRQWNLDPRTAQTVEQGGTYLHVTEVRPPS